MLVLIRIAWRAFNRPLPFPDGMSTWQRITATSAHWGLYALMLTLPVSGWAYSAAADYGPEWFGWVDLPAIFPVSESLEAIMHEIREWTGWLLLGPWSQCTHPRPCGISSN